MSPPLITALASAVPAVVPVDRLPGLLPDHAPEQLVRAVVVAIEAHSISVWEDCPQGPAILLSADQERILGLELEDADGQFRWVKAGQRSPRPALQAAQGDADPLDLLPSREPTAESVVEAADELERDLVHTRRRGGDYAPRNRVASASNPTASLVLASHRGRLDWPEGLEVVNQPGCPCCGGDVKSAASVCLACLRSGLDPLLEPLRRAALKAAAAAKAKEKGTSKAPEPPKTVAYTKPAKTVAEGKALRGGCGTKPRKSRRLEDSHSQQLST